MKLNSTKIIILGSLVAVVVLTALLLPRRPDGASRHPHAGPRQTLLVYCAAGIKPPVEDIARAYEKEFGVNVQLQYGGSGTLLSSIRISKAGDLFVAGDASYISIGREQGVIAEAIPLVRMHPVIVVRSGNPKHVQAVADLLRDDVSVALANPEAASIGKATQRLLEPTGVWAALKPRVKVFKPTVNDIANDVKLGTVDAGIVWDATARQYRGLQIVEAPPLAGATETVTVGVVGFSPRPAAALHFARYLAARDRGLPIFAQHHYEPVAGDLWADSPVIMPNGATLQPVPATKNESETSADVRQP